MKQFLETYKVNQHKDMEKFYDHVIEQQSLNWCGMDHQET